MLGRSYQQIKNRVKQSLLPRLDKEPFKKVVEEYMASLSESSQAPAARKQAETPAAHKKNRTSAEHQPESENILTQPQHAKPALQPESEGDVAKEASMDPFLEVVSSSNDSSIAQSSAAPVSSA